MSLLRKLIHSLPASWRHFVYALGSVLFRQELKHLSSMQVEEQGIEDNLPYLKLEGIPYRFYGHFTANEFLIMYRYLTGRKIRSTFNETHYQLACDIAYRYLGPKKEPLSTGKYYDFQPGDVVVEVGAYIGHYAMRVADIVGPSGKVIAIEAIAENYHILKKNVETNQLHQLIPIHKAAWHSEGTLTLHHMANQRASVTAELLPDTNTTEVPCDSVDNVLLSQGVEKVDFVRVQVNAAELEVLKGMEHSLSAGVKLLITAPYQIDGQPASEVVIDYLKTKGYNVTLHNKSIMASKRS